MYEWEQAEEREQIVDEMCRGRELDDGGSDDGSSDGGSAKFWLS